MIFVSGKLLNCHDKMGPHLPTRLPNNSKMFAACSPAYQATAIVGRRFCVLGAYFVFPPGRRQGKRHWYKY